MKKLMFVIGMLGMMMVPAFAEEKSSTAADVTKVVLDSKIVNTLADILSNLEQAIQTHAPEAAQLALTVVRFDAIMHIIEGVIFLGFIPIIIKIAAWFFHQAKTKKEKQPHTDWEVGMFFSFLIGGILTLACVAISLCDLLNFYAWAALIDPKLGLAYKLMAKLL